MSEINGRAMAAVAVGSLFLWSGIKGWSILGTFGDLISGRPPIQSVINPLTTGVQGEASGKFQTFGASGVAETASQYVGHAYSFGGAPGKDGSRPWDCSSFCNYVIGVKLGRAIPGYSPGKYDGSSHGPPTGVWAAWSGLQHIQRADLAAGDIIVWLGHMGIATGRDQMVSALNPAQKTRITPIEGYGNGPVLVYGRLR